MTSHLLRTVAVVGRAAVLFLVALLLGCGDGAPPLLPVSGQVTLDGKPLIGKTVRFIPEPGTPGVGAGGTTDREGRYSLLAARPGALRDMPGAPAGKYRVIVTEPMFPVDLDMPKDGGDDSTPAPAIGPPPVVPRKTTIPAHYTHAETTPLRLEIPGDGNFDLRLVSN